MKLLQISTVLLAAVLFSCSSRSDRKNSFERLDELMKDRMKTEEVNTDPVDVSIEDVFSGDYDRKEVLVFEGYVGLIPTTVSFSGGTMNVRVFPRRNQNGGNYVNVDIKLGTDKNNVHRLPEKYQQEDLTIVADDGTELGVGSRVKITADGYYSSNDYFSMDAVKIEAIGDDSFDDSAFDEATKLTTALVHDTSAHEVYGYMDGVFSIPRTFYSMYGDIGLNFNTSTNPDFDKIDVHVGTGPSTMDELPSSYTSKDLKIRDANGDLIPAGSKVRVYGTWERYSFVSSTGLGGKFYIEEIVKL